MNIPSQLTQNMIENSLISNIGNIYKTNDENILQRFNIANIDSVNNLVVYYDELCKPLISSASASLINDLHDNITTFETINQKDYETSNNSIFVTHFKLVSEIVIMAKELCCNKIVVTPTVLSLMQVSNFNRCQKDDNNHCDEFVGYLDGDCDLEVYVNNYGLDDSVLFIKNLDVNYCYGFILNNKSLESDLTIKKADVTKLVLENISFV